MKPGGRIAPMPAGRTEPKPHIYFWGRRWWVSRGGRRNPHRDVTSRPTFPEACHLAMLAAIHSGVWRA
jgi:hypothetical protein